MLNTAVKVHHRWMLRSDLPEVERIDALCCLHDPWSAEDYSEHLRQRNVIGIVAEIKELVVGVIIYTMERDSFTVNRLAVDPTYQRRSIGSQLIERLQAKLDPSKRKSIEVMTPESALSAQVFLRACNFRVVKIKRRAFECTGEDGYVFRHRVQVPELTEEPSEILR